MVRARSEAGVVVTGAASGIGLALSKAILAARPTSSPRSTTTASSTSTSGALFTASWRANGRRFLTSLGGEPYPVSKLAEDAIRGVERNLALIIAPRSARTAALLYRLAPSLIVRQLDKALARELADRPSP